MTRNFAPDLRRTARLARMAAATSALLLIPAALARDVCQTSESPQYEDDGRVKLECTGDEMPIEQYLDESICGGWNRDLEVMDTLGAPGKISKVVGVPGREGQPLGAVFTGMARRVEEGGVLNDGYLFPDTTIGLATACDEGKSQVTKQVWDENENKRKPKDFSYPFFKDPPCKWRLTGGGFPPVDPAPGLTFEELEDPHTPGLCAQFCSWLNAWKYSDCLEIGPELDADGNPVLDADGNPVPTCKRQGQRYMCTDAEVKGGDPCAAGVTVVPNEFPNSTGCLGPTCRCTGPGCMIAVTPADMGGGAHPYKSYFRQYAGGYSRAAVPDAPQDVTSKNARVACYGFYDEFDPRFKRTAGKDKRCIIDMDVPEMKDTQQGTGIYESGSVYDDPDPKQAANQRRGGAFDQLNDFWFELMSGGLSFYNVNKIDFESSLFQPDVAQFRAIYQINTTDKKMAPGNLTRAFDDSGPFRTVARWWQKQETAANTLFSPPLLQVVLPPPTWAIGIDEEDPLLVDYSNANGGLFGGGIPGGGGFDPDQSRDERSLPIDRQVHVKDDILGAVFSYIDRTFLQLREEPLPVIVPVGSPSEYRALAQAWCTWHIRKTLQPDCSGMGGAGGQIMNRLLEYADQIENVRKLRAELALYGSKLLETQKDVILPLSEWMRANLTAYRDYLARRALILEMKPLWTQNQTAMANFHEVANMPWCMNHRFTTPIYSMLDPWMPARMDQGNPVEQRAQQFQGLPTLEDVPIRPREELVLDLSILKTLTGALAVPVLRPVQVKIDIQKYAPPASDREPSVPPLPGLPSIDPIHQLLANAANQLPLACGPGSDPPCPNALEWPPIVRSPMLLSDQEILLTQMILAAMRQTLQEMTGTYSAFWMSLNPEDDDDLEGKKDRLECESWDAFPCIHVEMDLLERFTRIGSRPAVQLKEDYKSVGTPREFPGVCLPEDDSCVMMPPVRTDTRAGWQTIGEAPSNDISILREQIRRAGLPAPIGNIPADQYPPYDLKLNELLPGLEVPPDADLKPPSTP